MTYLIVAFLLSFIPQQQVGYASYGEILSKDEALSVADFIAQVNHEKHDFKVRGVVEDVCQMKGCWVTLRNDQNLLIRVKFKDYGFFVPKDISGSEIIMEGVGSLVQLKEEDARHYADDAGKAYHPSQRKEISFIASGLLVSVDE